VSGDIRFANKQATYIRLTFVLAKRKLGELRSWPKSGEAKAPCASAFSPKEQFVDQYGDWALFV